MPIDVQLPSGERVRVQTDDPQAAAKAARTYFEESQQAEGKRTEIAPPFDPAGENIPWHEQPATQTRPQAPPETGPENGFARDLTIGAQGTGRGLAELAGAPVDIATMALNAGAAGGEKLYEAATGEETDFGRIENPIGGSQSIRDAATAGAEAVALPLVAEDDLQGEEKCKRPLRPIGIGC
ncbi:hypothetical protein CKO28_18150 [Rhodovibrio sodomensis]|uniref:Uncharacterized protein n=1 Tax=Rhodovibrio sodomensis TaxID=1088 RepID=A0ABS1DHM3_9PROT|nr:hypothetical protein [Rhodovibrio sodomensis]MBK1669960.1 hypothetical protein [Rhodovibrio sodomensis]